MPISERVTESRFPVQILLSITFFLLSLVLLPAPGFPHPQQIILDGDFSDWQDIDPLCSDPMGEPTNGGVDFGRLWVTEDGCYLFISLELVQEIILQRELPLQMGNAIRMFVDVDNNPATGIPVYGIGAEIERIFGDKSGTRVDTSGSYPISHADINVKGAPSVSSTRFEIAIERVFVEPIASMSPSQQQKTIKIVFDDMGGAASYVFDDTPMPFLPSLSLAKHNGLHLRILTYNVKDDGILDPAREEHFERLLKAIDPDIVGFQELRSTYADETVALFESILPLTGGGQWHGAGIFPDIVAVSRYPITSSFPIEGYAPT